jgi:TM2 domain-containing membrane protein YozV
MDRRADLKNVPGMRDHSIAWLLLVFGGWLGLHRLYLHKWISGISIPIMTALTAAVFPLFFWLMVPLLILLLLDLWTLNSQVSEFNAKHQPEAYAPQAA